MRSLVGKVQVFVAVMFLVGLVMVGFGAYDYVGQSETLDDAVEVEATVLSAEVEKVSTRRAGVDYDTEVRFEYTYNGETYTSEGMYPVTFGPNYDTRESAEEVIEGYEAGETVTAYLDPNSPGNGFLKNETTKTPLFVAGIGTVMMLISGVSLAKPFR